MWNIKPSISNHGVRKFWIYWTLHLLSCFMELHGTLRNSDSQWIIRFTKDSPYTLTVILINMTFSSNKVGKLVDLWNIPDTSMNPSQANSETKKVWTLLQPKPSQAMLEEQHRQGAAVQPYPVITQPDQLHLCSTAAAEKQWQRSSRCTAAAAGRLRSISLVCVLHNTITLTLTAVRLSK